MTTYPLKSTEYDVTKDYRAYELFSFKEIKKINRCTLLRDITYSNNSTCLKPFLIFSHHIINSLCERLGNERWSNIIDINVYSLDTCFLSWVNLYKTYSLSVWQFHIFPLWFKSKQYTDRFLLVYVHFLAVSHCKNLVWARIIIHENEI